MSEGRDARRIAALTRAVEGAVIHADTGWDAHRTVLTLAGEVAEAAFRLAREAVRSIDLRTHHGIHPRMGAIDVIPFVPLDGEVAVCHRLAEDLSLRIAGELALPVYRYGIGSRRLFDVRRRGFEGLADTMRRVPPDFGPDQPHPSAGAVAVGVREVLVAFNVCLETSDVSVARVVAREVRKLPAVEAIGWKAERLGWVQVSTNLVNWHRTPPHLVYEAVRRLAPVAGSELVGLMPEGALRAAAGYYGTDLAGAADRLGLSVAKPFSLDEHLLERRLGRIA